jgi:predicted ABC-type ATPase
VRLDLIVGPNGSGKTTFVGQILLPAVPPGTAFVNADEIAKRTWPEAPEAMSYEAAQVADRTRRALIEAKRPLIAETVFSHPSKLDLISLGKARGYTVVLHAVMVPEDLTVLRVRHRVASGGHAVPEHKIRERYRRLWPLVRQAVSMCDTALVYDNSANGRPVIAAQYVGGVLVGAAKWPDWAPQHILA